MRRMLARVEVQRILILAFGSWLLAGAVAGAPLAAIVLLAALATTWTFLLGWSLTLDSAVARTLRVTVGAAAAAGCALAFGASSTGAVAVALVTAVLLAGAERVMRRRVSAA